MSDMNGKICVVTGANSGIGFVTARELARQKAHVVMVCRNEEKAVKAQGQIKNASGNVKVDLFLADFASQKQIRAVAEKIMGSYPRIDVLVNNAGLMTDRRRTTDEGYEYTFAVNHLGYFLFTNLLLGWIKEAGNGRIVNVASEVHRLYRFDFNDIHLQQDYSNLKAYALSKRANIMFNTALSDRLRGTGVTTNALHPGAVASNFGKGSGGWFKTVLDLSRIFMISPEKGAQTSIYLASSPEVEGVSGKYFDNKKQKSPSSQCTNMADCQRLWELSEEMTGLKS